MNIEISPTFKERTGDTTESADSSATESSLPTLPCDTFMTNMRYAQPTSAQSRQPAGAEGIQPSPTSTLSSPVKGYFSTAVPRQPQHAPTFVVVDSDHALPLNSRPPKPSRPQTTSSSPSSSLRRSPQRSRDRSRRPVSPLQPLPGNPTYDALNYYKATALCRKRGIPSGGTVQEVRNTLVQDDTNVQLGRQRAKASSHHRKQYKTEAPGEGNTRRGV